MNVAHDLLTRRRWGRSVLRWLGVGILVTGAGRLVVSRRVAAPGNCRPSRLCVSCGARPVCPRSGAARSDGRQAGTPS